MKVPPIKEDESLAMWRERLAQEFNLDLKMQEILREVSITSYIHGTNTIIDTLKKEGKL
jgi:hypothetical protein